MVLELKNRPSPRSPSFTTADAVTKTLAGLISAERGGREGREGEGGRGEGGRERRGGGRGGRRGREGGRGREAG